MFVWSILSDSGETVDVKLTEMTGAEVKAHELIAVTQEALGRFGDWGNRVASIKLPLELVRRRYIWWLVQHGIEVHI